MSKDCRLLSPLLLLTSIGCMGDSQPVTERDQVTSIASGESEKMAGRQTEPGRVYEELRDGNRSLQLGPVRRKLSDEQIARVGKVAGALREVHPLSIEQWNDGFIRDKDPESEIQLWERVAEAYRSYCTEHALASDAKSEVFSILLTRTMMSAEQVLESAKPQHLNVDQIKDILTRISVEPKPLELESRP